MMCQYNFFWNFIKNLESWYKTNIVDTNNTEYIAENVFCNDKIIYRGATGIGQEGTGYNGQFVTSLECAEGANNDYSRFTSKNNTNDTTIKGVKVNKDLTYPIGLLSYNEAKYVENSNFSSWDGLKTFLYLFDYSRWWIMTPNYYFVDSNPDMISFFDFNNSSAPGTGPGSDELGFRPVKNLKASVLINGGDGMQENPYTLKLK